MKKLLLMWMVILAIGASAQIVVNEGFENPTTPPGFVYSTFFNTTDAGRICTGAGAVNANLYSFSTTSSLTYSSAVSNGTALTVSFNYNVKEYSSGSGVGGTYKVEYSANGGTTYTQIGSDIVVNAEQACTPFTGTVATGLIPLNANFKFRISGLFTSGDFYFTVDDLILQQVVSCAAPLSAGVTAVTSGTATVNWVAAPSAPANGYDVYYSTSSTPPNSTTVPNSTGVAGTSLPITGLMSATTYYVFVRSNCSATDKSNWIAAPSFLTPCITVSSYSQNFDTTSTSLPVCWVKVGNGGSAYIQTSTFGSAPNSLYMYSFTTDLATVKMPQVNTLQLGTYRLKFKIGGNFSTGGKLEVGYFTNEADPSTFVGLDSFTANTLTGEDVVLNSITAPAGVTALVFRLAGVPSNSIQIDNVVYELTPTCAEPSALITSNISTTTVDLGWTAPPTAPANGYEIYYSTSNVPPTAATVPNVTGINATNTIVGGLNPSTTYYIYVRSNCSATDKSPWVSANAIVTACIPITTLPWSENFDAMTTIGASILPPCWTTVGSAPYTSANAGSNSFNDPRSNPNYVTVYYPTGTSYLWTPGFTLTAGTSYNFSFFWAGDTYPGWQGDLLVNTSQSDAGATPVGASFVLPGTTTTANYTQSTNTFVPATTGTYYFAVKTFSATFDPYYMGFDDFKLELTPSCAEPINIAATAITTTSATLGWAAPASAPANGYEYAVTTTNTAPASGTATTATSIPLANLLPSTTYYVFIRSICSGGQSTWATYSFTTPALPPVNDECATPTVVTPGATFATNPVNGTFAAATTDTPVNCGFASGSYNVWYSVVVPASGEITIATDEAAGSTVTDTLMEVFGGTCGSLTSILCDDDGGNGAFSQVTLTSTNGITPGQTLLISVWKYGTAAVGTTPTFQISAFSSSLGTNDVVKAENNLTVYPNPFTDFIRISDVKNVASISIIDMSGKLVKTVKPEREINLSDLTTGMYLINLKLKDGSVQTVKAIKK